MSEKAAEPKDVITLDVETNVQTTEGRIFLTRLNTVSHVLHLKDTIVKFKGEELAKTGYVGDYKSLILYKCPNGYFLFGDKAFGKNNNTWIGNSMEEVLSQVDDDEVKQRLSDELATSKAA